MPCSPSCSPSLLLTTDFPYHVTSLLSVCFTDVVLSPGRLIPLGSTFPSLEEIQNSSSLSLPWQISQHSYVFVIVENQRKNISTLLESWKGQGSVCDKIDAHPRISLSWYPWVTKIINSLIGLCSCICNYIHLYPENSWDEPCEWLTANRSLLELQYHLGSCTFHVTDLKFMYHFIFLYFKLKKEIKVSQSFSGQFIIFLSAESTRGSWGVDHTVNVIQGNRRINPMSVEMISKLIPEMMFQYETKTFSSFSPSRFLFPAGLESYG